MLKTTHLGKTAHYTAQNNPYDTCLPFNALKTAQIRLRKAVIVHSSKASNFALFSLCAYVCV